MKKEFQLGRDLDAQGEARTVLVIDGVHHDLRACLAVCGKASHPHDMGALLADWGAAFPVLSEAVGQIVARGDADLRLPEDIALISPVPRPGTIYCAAANYSDHVKEMAKTGFTGPSGAQKNVPTVPRKPYHFLKSTTCCIGPNDAIELPSEEHRIDWEVELAVVIGAPAKRVRGSGTMAHVAGYVVVNDISCRAATWRDDRPNIRSDWLSGKSYDTFFPIGPYFQPAEFVEDYRTLRLRLWVNGQLQQDGLAKDMIFDIEQQIEYLSAMLTLESGDLIATGTPAGVGQGKGAYLKPGDLVEAEITGMGRQRNPVRL